MITGRARLRNSDGAYSFPSVLRTAPVGAKVYFDGERQGYTVQARDSRYLVCTKPFNVRRTVLYSIVDLEDGIRGPENLMFCMGAETRAQCEAMLARVSEAQLFPVRDFRTNEPVGAHARTETEISWRHRCALMVTRVVLP